VVPPWQLSDVVDSALTSSVARRGTLPDGPGTLAVPSDSGDLGLDRNLPEPRRPDLRQLLKYGATDVLPLNGTGQGEKDPGLLLALARFGGSPAW
jgi:hypothetical protein